jgi:type I restriction enzyme S subunit
MSDLKRQKLRKYITQVRGVSYKPSDIKNESFENSLAILKANNITDHGLDDKNVVYIDRTRIKNEQIIRTGDILLAASSGSKKALGRNIFFYGNHNATFGAFCKVVRPGKGIYPDYLKHFFKTNYFRSQIERRAQGVNINNIKNEHLDNLEIFLPDQNNQIRIAHVLSKVEALITQRRQSLQLLDDLLKSVFLKMFGDPVRNEKGWDCKRLSEILSKIESGSSPKCEAREANLNEWGVLKLGAVTSCKFIASENKALPHDIQPKIKHEVRGFRG